MKTLIPLIALIALSACSNKQLYQAGQDYQKSKCISEAQNEADFSKCVNAQQQSYQDYKKAREIQIKKND